MMIGKDYLMKKKLMLINLDLLKDLMSLRFVFRVFVLKLLLSFYFMRFDFILRLQNFRSSNARRISFLTDARILNAISENLVIYFKTFWLKSTLIPKFITSINILYLIHTTNGYRFLQLIMMSYGFWKYAQLTFYETFLYPLCDIKVRLLRYISQTIVIITVRLLRYISLTYISQTIVILTVRVLRYISQTILIITLLRNISQTQDLSCFLNK
ncbi:hypothetical protein KUTeg_005387 [Tegillarca granosa]|uniref:Uncharacterized protein n=1 Tax=Tegillarca granosa TaxID=220873 RepID=A0ABQ9FJJ9_TEGGR|nr:hypothetical protein KUTeg_005387 [Tegillarca granosa]